MNQAFKNCSNTNLNHDRAWDGKLKTIQNIAKVVRTSNNTRRSNGDDIVQRPDLQNREIGPKFFPQRLAYTIIKTLAIMGSITTWAAFFILKVNITNNY